jgi:hypothetical protein
MALDAVVLKHTVINKGRNIAIANYRADNRQNRSNGGAQCNVCFAFDTAPNCSQFIGINHRIKMGFEQAVMGSVNQCKGGLSASSKCLNMIKIQTFKMYIKKVNRKFKETSFQTAEGTSIEFLKNMLVY